MKIKRISLLIVFVLAVLLVFPSPSYAQSPNGDGKIVFGGSYELNAGETLNGDLAVFGGIAKIHNEAKVNGDIFITGGLLEVDGSVSGDVVAIGGSISLGSHSVIDGNLTTVNAPIKKADGAIIKGNTTVQTPGAFDLKDLPFFKLPLTIRPGAIQPKVNLDILKPLGDMLWAVLKSFGLAALALILMLFLATPTERVAQSIVKQPVFAGGLGLLTIIIAPALLLLLGITIILLPLSLLGLLVLAIALLYGWFAIGFEVGKRLTLLLKWNCTAPVSAGLGTLVLTLVVSAVSWIPCVGWLAPAIVLMLGLGGVFISGFGIKDINATTPAPPPVAPTPATAPIVPPPAIPAAPEVLSASQVPPTTEGEELQQPPEG